MQGKAKKVKLPKPELYVIFTGNTGRKPDKISLSQEFFEGADMDMEVTATVFYERDRDDIINQHLVFCKVFNEQTKLVCPLSSRQVKHLRFSADDSVQVVCPVGF